jgi:hypothetical protein
MPLPGPFLVLALLCPGLLLGTAFPVDPNSTTGLGSTSLDNFTLFGETVITVPSHLSDLKREQALAHIVARPQDAIQAVLDSGGDIFEPIHRIFQYLTDRLMPQPAPPR